MDPSERFVISICVSFFPLSSDALGDINMHIQTVQRRCAPFPFLAILWALTGGVYVSVLLHSSTDDCGRQLQ